MKKLILIPFMVVISTLITIGCDPSESLEYDIVNNTPIDLKLHFVSNLIYSEIPNNDKIVKILSNEVYNDETGNNNLGLGQAMLSFTDFDSIYITNLSDKVLKVYKENIVGKNIYNIDDYWSVRKTSKNHFEYTYEITNEDIKE